MNRLHHSFSGHLRLMQMSTTQLFIFVEGKQCDPYFFASICSATLDDRLKYEIAIARQLPGDTGGKQALISFFEFLRMRKSLFSDLGGQKTTCLFFLDKDIDDLQRRKLRSRHVVYTQHYDVQNYIFKHGNLVTGTSAAASIDPRRIDRQLTDASEWCRKAASLWRDWIALCLRMLEDGIPCEANYRVLSPIQTRYCGPTDINLHLEITRRLARRNRIPVSDLRRRIELSRRKVSRYFAKEEHHRIFKGKWFAIILADDVDRIMAGDPYDNNGLPGRLPSAIAATLDFTEAWTEYFKQPLREISMEL